MKTTTRYSVTITRETDAAGNTTTRRAENVESSTVYRFTELTPDAQERAIHDAIEEEQRAYYESGWYGASHTGIMEAEIWHAAEELEKSQPLEIDTDQGGSAYGTARGSGYYRHEAEWERVTEAKDSGDVYSMDICDVWNAYAARIIILQNGHEDAEAESLEHYREAEAAHDVYQYADVSDADRETARKIYEQEHAADILYEQIAQRCAEAAEELTEEAARAVGNTIDGLIEAEREWYASAEFWREWLRDGDEEYTADGARA